MNDTNSKLLKESIADAKAVRETAIANAKIMLEEAFAPRIRSAISKKIKENVDITLSEEYGVDDVKGVESSKIGAGKGKSGSGTTGSKPAGKSTQSHTKLDPETTRQSSSLGAEDKNNKVVDKLTENDEEDEFDLDEILRELEGVDDMDLEEGGDPEPEMAPEDSPEPEEEVEEAYGTGDDMDDLDLDEILRELEGSEEDDMEVEEASLELDEADDFNLDDLDLEESESDAAEDTVDLDELLRELGLNEDETEEAPEDKPGSEELEELRTELDEAYKAIRSLKTTINEVNLLNAKLLYANKLFRHYNLTNEQKIKIVENIDRTTNVREVKLVYATLAESMKFTGTKTHKTVKAISENFASKVTRSTAPKKEILSESNEIADRFKKLAGINK